MNTYTPKDRTSGLTFPEIIESARLASSGIPDPTVASHIGVTRDVIRKGRRNVTMAVAIAFPDFVDFDEVSAIHNGRVSQELFERISMIHSKYRAIEYITSLDNTLARDIRAQPHFASFLDGLVRGYSVMQISQDASVEIPNWSACRLAETLVNTLCLQEGNPTGLHMLLKKMLFNKWTKYLDNWFDFQIEEEDYENSFDVALDGDTSEYGLSLNIYEYLRYIVNDNPRDFLSQVDFPISRYTRLSPATNYFIGGYLNGYTAKELVQPFKGLTQYSDTTLISSLSSGIRHTENLLLVRNGKMSQKQLVRTRSLELAQLVHNIAAAI